MRKGNFIVIIVQKNFKVQAIYIATGYGIRKSLILVISVEKLFMGNKSLDTTKKTYTQLQASSVFCAISVDKVSNRKLYLQNI